MHYRRAEQPALSARLSALAADTARKLDVLGHDGDALGVDSAEVGVLEEANQVRLAGFLEGQDSQGLEAQVCMPGVLTVRGCGSQLFKHRGAVEEYFGGRRARGGGEGEGFRPQTHLS